ncbi:hypothetical protein ALC57_10398, partial [Trachymyrmex cornetzi]
HRILIVTCGDVAPSITTYEYWFCRFKNSDFNVNDKCSVTCGTGIRTRTIECKDGVGAISRDCDLAERPHTEQECKTNVACPTYGDGMSQPLVQPYPLSPMSEKLMDQPIPSEST